MNPQSSFHIWREEKAQGPFGIAELKAMLKTGQIHFATQVQEAGMDDWVPLSTYEDVLIAPIRTTGDRQPESFSGSSAAPGAINLTKAGGILTGIALVLALILGFGLVELLLLAAGIILLVVGLSRN